MNLVLGGMVHSTEPHISGFTPSRDSPDPLHAMVL